MLLDAGKAAALLFVAALAQVSLIGAFDVLGGKADLVLVTLVGVALLRGSVFGAGGGFLAGLVLDTATLGTLGFHSLLLTIAGYWIGRYGETTGRDRAHAPLLSVAVVTVLYAAAALALHFVLGQPSPARLVLVDTLLPGVLLNLLVAIPVYSLCRRLIGPRGGAQREVQLLA